jgi:hypothetical protein
MVKFLPAFVFITKFANLAKVISESHSLHMVYPKKRFVRERLGAPIEGLSQIMAS